MGHRIDAGVDVAHDTLCLRQAFPLPRAFFSLSFAQAPHVVAAVLGKKDEDDEDEEEAEEEDTSDEEGANEAENMEDGTELGYLTDTTLRVCAWPDGGDQTTLDCVVEAEACLQCQAERIALS